MSHIEMSLSLSLSLSFSLFGYLENEQGDGEILRNNKESYLKFMRVRCYWLHNMYCHIERAVRHEFLVYGSFASAYTGAFRKFRKAWAGAARILHVI